MDMRERIHKLAVELHSWIDNRDFKSWPEPSIKEIEDEIRNHLGLDALEFRMAKPSEPVAKQ